MVIKLDRSAGWRVPDDEGDVEADELPLALAQQRTGVALLKR